MGTMNDINTHNLICDFGRHAGVPYTRLPVSYLRWMVNSGHPKATIAEAELKRRGTTFPRIDISGHAIDRASYCAMEAWIRTRLPNEGLHAWLVRVAQEARDRARVKKGRYHHLGLMFAFEEGEYWPVLLTVMREKK
ncbi:putative quorum-sensing-regulated virulence factor [Pelomicrobium sp. G1]|uniref:putative quorum-sensing-regulated virulence factor n=1 Tax=unclassified Pelomicrobium TaxID=2815318 RepID=UPI003F7583C9